MNIRFPCPVCETPGRLSVRTTFPFPNPQGSSAGGSPLVAPQPVEGSITSAPRPQAASATSVILTPPAPTWRCPYCDHCLDVPEEVDPTLPACAICGNAELYKKKNFPHSLGMGILVGACVTSTITYWLYDKTLTWGILLGSAAIDGLLYLWVPDVIVCYRCNAHHSGALPNTEHKPFELSIHERYRQERQRKERMKDEG